MFLIHVNIFQVIPIVIIDIVLIDYNFDDDYVFRRVFYQCKVIMICCFLSF